MVDLINKLKEAVSLLEHGGMASNKKIGIGINTHNRPDMLRQCLENVKKFAPPNSEIVIVDDASYPTVDCTFRFDENVGISVAKNKTLELLYERGCDHFFLFDDDTWPTSDMWWEPYCDSSQPHLMYIFQKFKNGSTADGCKVIHRDDEVVAYTKPRGCMLYYERVCLDTVGGMFSGFHKWGWEHVDLSDRIFNAGLTKFPYMDVVQSGLIHSDDEINANVNTTVKGPERNDLIAKNSKLYDSRFGSLEYVNFAEKKNIFITCMLSGVPDPQRPKEENSIKIDDLSTLVSSICSTKSTLVVLHDNFKESEICRFAHSNKCDGNVIFKKVPTCVSNPYFYRWSIYRDYLLENVKLISSVICVDATDVEVLHSPNWNIVNSRLVTGDEISILNDPHGWMKKNHTGPMSEAFLSEYGKVQMLNAGTLGSSAGRVIDFCSKIIHFWQSAGASHSTDMLIFNYVCRTFFETDLYHGRTVNTPFKHSELNGKNDYSWIKHK